MPVIFPRAAGNKMRSISFAFYHVVTYYYIQTVNFAVAAVAAAVYLYVARFHFDALTRLVFVWWRCNRYPRHDQTCLILHLTKHAALRLMLLPS